MNIKLFAAILIITLVPLSSLAGEGAPGEDIYEERCLWCHGEEGYGDGPAAEYLNPPPRDFSEVSFKFKTTPFFEMVPTDGDIERAIKGELDRGKAYAWGGLGGASMPGYGAELTARELGELVSYIKLLSGIEEEPIPEPISFKGRIAPGPKSIEEGKRLFEHRERCTECHGSHGRGDGTKRLKDDLGYRTWPRNLTKGWSYRISNDPGDIYARITVGLPGTQMPSFADPKSKKALSEDERWHVANYVASLDAPYKKPAGESLIRASYVDGPLPSAASDERWRKARFTSFHMVPQIITEPRLFTPSVDSISVKALFNESGLSLLIEWDDRTESIPGDEKSMKIAGGDPYPDRIAVQTPLNAGQETPYFGEGETENPVVIRRWQSKDSTAGSEASALFIARGPKDRKPLSGAFDATGLYEAGSWRVVMRGDLNQGEPANDGFKRGDYIPVAFAAWDGSNMDTGSRHTMTGWHYILLEPNPSRTHLIWPLAVAALLFIAELSWFTGRKD